eukprot:Skav205117  [mRNA]  locus=scaffold1864:227639:228715:+ [translate_table: standard]
MASWCTKALPIAVKQGHAEKVQLLLASRADPEKKDGLGNTAINLAAGRGHADTTRVLLEAGVFKEARNLQGDNLLLLAIKSGNGRLVTYVLDAQVSLETQDSMGNTPLQLAAGHGFLLAVRLLIDRKADTHAINQDGNTALHLAASVGQDETIKELLTWGANVNGTNKDGLTPVHLAIKSWHPSTVELLIDNEANLEHGGVDPLFLAIQNGSLAPTDLQMEKQMATMTLLIDRGLSNVNARNKDGRTPFLHVAELGQTHLVGLLVQKQADINAKVNMTGSTPLLLAARRGHAMTAVCIKQQLESLLKSKAKPENLWKRKQHARQLKDLEEQIRDAIQIANKKGYNPVAKLLRSKEQEV